MSEVLEPGDILYRHKPAGIATHRPSPEHQGFVEALEQQTHQKLYVCHRLDKETSGAMIFAKNKKAAKIIGEMFAQQQVRKEYLFVSDKKSQHQHWWVGGEEGEGALLGERPRIKGGNNFEGVTEFERLSHQGPLFLYKALPRTGKTHQIRKHAVQSNITILGDKTYGGTNFPRLMLHAERLSFESSGETFRFSAKPSRLFRDLSLCNNPQLSCWLHSYERRELLFEKLLDNSQALRLLHSETTDLRGDLVGEHLVMGWWRSERPTEREQENIRSFCKLLKIDRWVFQWRPGAQQSQSTELLLSEGMEPDKHWVFEENGIKFSARLGQGQNFGLFLDQRDRRQWLKDHSQDKKVLNLFSFTCGFSLYAALGGASQVVSVDSSAPYLDWGKSNFTLNDLDPQSYEFRKMDSLSYLDFAKKKNLQFDLIVCDPPSFSRNKKNKSVFRIEKDFSELIEACGDVLAPGGQLLFSCNYEKWSLSQWQKKLEGLAAPLGFEEVSMSPSQWDYEWQNQQANLKAFFLTKA